MSGPAVRCRSGSSTAKPLRGRAHPAQRPALSAARLPTSPQRLEDCPLRARTPHVPSFPRMSDDRQLLSLSTSARRQLAATRLASLRRHADEGEYLGTPEGHVEQAGPIVLKVLSRVPAQLEVNAAYCRFRTSRCGRGRLSLSRQEQRATSGRAQTKTNSLRCREFLPAPARKDRRRSGGPTQARDAARVALQRRSSGAPTCRLSHRLVRRPSICTWGRLKPTVRATGDRVEESAAMAQAPRISGLRCITTDNRS